LEEGPVIFFNLLNADSQPVGGFYVFGRLGCGDWRELRKTFILEEHPGAAWLRVSLSFYNASGIIWWDQAELSRTEPAQRPAEPLPTVVTAEVEARLRELKHPYLFLSGEEIEALREKIAQQAWAAQAWQGILQSADGLLGQEVRLPERGYGHYGVAENARNLGLAYQVTGEEKYAEAARRLALASGETEPPLCFAGREWPDRLRLSGWVRAGQQGLLQLHLFPQHARRQYGRPGLCRAAHADLLRGLRRRFLR
jgi:hypothetical protein